MGFLRRLFRQPDETRNATSRPDLLKATSTFGGSDPLEVVGESFYQEAIKKIVGPTNEYVRVPVSATLQPESDNRHDPNAISVWISGLKVGYLSRGDAVRFRLGLLGLQRQVGAGIALPGVIVGGGEDRPSYGVFLNYAPGAFNLVSDSSARPHIERQVRTGLSNAVGGDVQNADYDLAWRARVPLDRLKAMTFLRHELVSEPEAISRHFMYTQLEEFLYGARDDLASALNEYDAACEAHHSEMSVIRPALIKLFDGVPLIEMYKQAAIRHQKAHDWQVALRWAEAGLQVYGTEALQQEFVDDLERRAADYREKLTPRSDGRTRGQQNGPQS
jgi:hypothetical protein